MPQLGQLRVLLCGNTFPHRTGVKGPSGTETTLPHFGQRAWVPLEIVAIYVNKQLEYIIAEPSINYHEPAVCV